ncbi:MAG: hypothetical protein ACOYLO_00340 [Ferruginibacter sp.]
MENSLMIIKKPDLKLKEVLAKTSVEINPVTIAKEIENAEIESEVLSEIIVTEPIDSDINWDNIDIRAIPVDILDEILMATSEEDMMRCCRDDFDFASFIKIEPGCLNGATDLPVARVDSYCEAVWFKNCSFEKAENWLYYACLEREAKLSWFDGKNILYVNASSDKLDRIIAMSEKEIDSIKMEKFL